MHDIKFIRNAPEDFDILMKRRGIKPISSEILVLDTLIRNFQTESQKIQEKRNTDSKLIGKMISQGEDTTKIQKEISELKLKINDLDQKIKLYSNQLNNILNDLPNFFDSDVPDGKTEDDNVLIKEWGVIKKMSFIPLDHVQLGENLKQLDFKTGVKLSGSRFVLLRGKLALLERALASFMLDIHTDKFGFEEISPPYIVNKDALLGTGQLPKFSEDLFCTKDERWLIPTAEVPLTNIVSNSIINKSDLPLKFVAHTPCFRSEAGAAGSDTRGMIRQHQFSKVEMVSITQPDESDKELDSLVLCAESILQNLGLPYRIMKLCSGDVGFSSRKTYDLEVWLPGQNNGKGSYREISSCSNCGDFQARRMNSKFKDNEANKINFLHTLNGSGLAVGRTMIAVLENYQLEDGSIVIPQVLVPYMKGLTKIENKY
ncbi:serine--tRNA ligase [Alphaproteobacteria bacterium]|nr:serine--tRNA ligase [Alphaproteobacteria bacterium]